MTLRANCPLSQVKRMRSLLPSGPRILAKRSLQGLSPDVCRRFPGVGQALLCPEFLSMCVPKLTQTGRQGTLFSKSHTGSKDPPFSRGPFQTSGQRPSKTLAKGQGLVANPPDVSKSCLQSGPPCQIPQLQDNAPLFTKEVPSSCWPKHPRPCHRWLLAHPAGPQSCQVVYPRPSPITKGLQEIPPSAGRRPPPTQRFPEAPPHAARPPRGWLFRRPPRPTPTPSLGLRSFSQLASLPGPGRNSPQPALCPSWGRHLQGT